MLGDVAVPGGGETIPLKGFGPNPADPSIDIEKTPDSQIVVSGDTATFTINVTNTGNVDLTDVEVTDTNAPDCDSTIGALAAGASIVEYTCTVANVTSGFTNSAVVTGDYQGGEVTDQDDADVAVADISIAKSAVTPIVESGDTATWTIKVENVGEVDLMDTSVSDALASDCALDATAVQGQVSSGGGTVLSVGEYFEYECTEASVTTGFTNSATADANAEGPVPVTDTDTDPVAVAEIEITIVKTVLSDLPLVDGGVIEFQIRVTNTGEVDLRQTAVDDPLFGPCVRSAAQVRVEKNGHGNNVGFVFTPNESFVYTCADELSVGFTNVATATATVSGVDVSDDDDAVVTVVNPDIMIVKSPDEQVLPNSGIVFFTITVTNTGDVTLRQTAVTDPLALVCARDAAAFRLEKNGHGNNAGFLLTPGEVVSWVCGLEVAEGFTNTASVAAMWEGIVIDEFDNADVLDPIT